MVCITTSPFGGACAPQSTQSSKLPIITTTYTISTRIQVFCILSFHLSVPCRHLRSYALHQKRGIISHKSPFLFCFWQPKYSLWSNVWSPGKGFPCSRKQRGMTFWVILTSNEGQCIRRPLRPVIQTMFFSLMLSITKLNFYIYFHDSLVYI